MEQINYLSQDEKFNKYFIIAILSHVGVVVILWLFQVLLGLDWFQSRDTKKDINLIQSSIRVDVVEMPKFTVQELKKMQVAPPSQDEKTEEVEESKDNSQSDLTFKENSKKVDLSNLLNNLSNKKTAKAKVEKVKGKPEFEIDKSQLNKLVLEGNKVSKGMALVGDSLNQENGAFADYVSGLPNVVRPFWKLPTYLMEKNLKCRIRVYIAADGSLLRAQIFESSGEQEFDQKAMMAVNSAKRFPAPQKEIFARVAAGEVILGFPL
jgi:colicin import membrane protein